MSREITVLLFGPPTSLAGIDRVVVHVDRLPVTVSTVLERVRALRPCLPPSVFSWRVAVNYEYAGPDQPISQDDEVALIGPVSGG